MDGNQLLDQLARLVVERLKPAMLNRAEQGFLSRPFTPSTRPAPEGKPTPAWSASWLGSAAQQAQDRKRLGARAKDFRTNVVTHSSGDWEELIGQNMDRAVLLFGPSNLATDGRFSLGGPADPSTSEGFYFSNNPLLAYWSFYRERDFLLCTGSWWWATAANTTMYVVEVIDI